MSSTLCTTPRKVLKDTIRPKKPHRVRITASFGPQERLAADGQPYFVYRYLMQDEDLNDFVHDATQKETFRGYGPGTVPLARAEVGDWLEVERTMYRGFVILKWRRCRSSRRTR